MFYILEGHNFDDEVISMLLMFYPNSKFSRLEKPEGDFYVRSVLTERAYCTIYDKGRVYEKSQDIEDKNDIREIKRAIKLSIFHCAKDIFDIPMPWGIITGIRPAKRVIDMQNDGFNDDEIIKTLKEKYLVSDEKIRLTMNVAKKERHILENNNPGKISLYAGIPFCPTRCLYCSFTSYSLKQYAKKVDSYIDCIEKEFLSVRDIIKDKEIESIYIGGGTPTSLNESQLERFMDMICRYFKKPLEFTVEAGRPDTVTRQKLRILKSYGVNRISINPQTMNDKTLKIIGREHTVQDFIDAFNMARLEGHKHINTDIILGLVGENEDDAAYTMQKLSELSPESITVHTLAVKRASRLRENIADFSLAKAQTIQKMIETASKAAYDMGMYPYYMYRQKNMLGNLENTGWCKPENECIYNVQIMEEKQSIIAMGAGGSTKVYDEKENKVERVFNVKSVDDYINRIDEMIKRKEDFFNVGK